MVAAGLANLVLCHWVNRNGGLAGPAPRDEADAENPSAGGGGGRRDGANPFAAAMDYDGGGKSPDKGGTGAPAATAPSREELAAVSAALRKHSASLSDGKI